jgi:hypothetical protein
VCRDMHVTFMADIHPARKRTVKLTMSRLCGREPALSHLLGQHALPTSRMICQRPDGVAAAAAGGTMHWAGIERCVQEMLHRLPRHWTTMGGYSRDSPGSE